MPLARDATSRYRFTALLAGRTAGKGQIVSPKKFPATVFEVHISNAYVTQRDIDGKPHEGPEIYADSFEEAMEIAEDLNCTVSGELKAREHA